MKLSALATAGGGGSSSGDGIYLGVGNTLGSQTYGFALGSVVQGAINASAGLTQVVNVPGPGVISFLKLTGIPSTLSNHTVRVVVDGVEKVNSTISASVTTFNIINGMTTTSGSILIKYDTSFVVEYTNVNATNVTVEYQAIRTQ